ncbi:TraB/GumN family protein [Phenylobacterium sp.]|uniref:TraB/GumN family protein n=1 Tax=Phenylobacterium sp. TaxID=1871053 RepID=UPI0025D34FDA|nr:TraB/GumN family protein [Phenylobacterium sp.]
MRILAGLLAALVLALPAAPSPARAAPPVWVVRDADSEMVLFGSIHVLPPGLAWSPPTLDAALKQADDLWFELPPGPVAEQEIARLAATTGVLPPGKSLFALLTPKDAELLLRAAEELGVDKATLDRLEPWLAEVAIAAASYRAAGADTDNGVEKSVEGATPSRVKRAAFETPAEQLGLFDNSPLDEQIASLNQTVRELAEDPDAYGKLVRAWMAGDTRVLDDEALEPMRKASPALFKRLVTDRNARWIGRLETRLKGKGRTVVVVGVGHLIGEGGLPSRLRALGYSVTGP